MRFGTGTARFDLSDATPPVDSVDAALNIAAEVLADYGDTPGDTRIERLARFVLLNVGEVPSLERCAELARKHESSVWSLDDAVYVTAASRRMSPEDARYLAALILRAAGRAEA